MSSAKFSLYFFTLPIQDNLPFPERKKEKFSYETSISFLIHQRFKIRA
jgi:hypothetical protein